MDIGWKRAERTTPILSAIPSRESERGTSHADSREAGCDSNHRKIRSIEDDNTLIPNLSKHVIHLDLSASCLRRINARSFDL